MHTTCINGHHIASSIVHLRSTANTHTHAHTHFILTCINVIHWECALGMWIIHNAKCHTLSFNPADKRCCCRHLRPTYIIRACVICFGDTANLLATVTARHHHRLQAHLRNLSVRIRILRRQLAIPAYTHNTSGRKRRQSNRMLDAIHLLFIINIDEFNFAGAISLYAFSTNFKLHGTECCFVCFGLLPAPNSRLPSQSKSLKKYICSEQGP